MRVVVLGQAILHEPVDWSDEVLALTEGADAVICNFEGCLPPPDAWPMKTKTVHPMHRDAPEMLKALGVTHLGLANNHAWDYGYAGILATRARTLEAGFTVAGSGRDAAEAWSPAIQNGVALISLDAGPTPSWAVAGTGPGIASLGLVSGLGLPREHIKALVALSEATGDAERRRMRQAAGFDAPVPGPRPFGLALQEAEFACETMRPDADALDRARQSIEAARTEVDIVVVAIHYHHWSPDWLTPPGWFGSVADNLADAGANAVAGTGPPWSFSPLQSGQRLIAAGLGNLAFHTRRADVYERLGLPVWKGQAADYRNGAWRITEIPVERPSN